MTNDLRAAATQIERIKWILTKLCYGLIPF